MVDETNTAVVEETPAVEAAEVQATPEPTPLEELFGTSEPKPEGDKPSPDEVKAEEKPEEKTEEKAEEGKEETPSPEVKPEDAVKAEYEKRLKETRDWTTRVNAENAQLKRDLAEQNKYLTMINKKLDGTWTEADELAAATPPQPTPEQSAQYGHTQGKVDASREAAYEIYGKEEVENTLFAEGAPFRAIMDDPIVKQKVLSSNAPVIEAMKIVKVKQFYDKWGYEPASIEKNMRESIEKELTDKITQKLIKQMNGKQTISAGIRDVRSADKSDSVVVHTPLEELFPRH